MLPARCQLMTPEADGSPIRDAKTMSAPRLPPMLRLPPMSERHYATRADITPSAEPPRLRQTDDAAADAR